MSEHSEERALRDNEPDRDSGTIEAAKVLLMVVCHAIYLPIFHQNYVYLSNPANEHSRWLKINGMLAYANIPLLAISALLLCWVVIVLLLRQRRWYFATSLVMAIPSFGYSGIYIIAMINHVSFSWKHEFTPKWDQKILILMMVAMALQVIFSRLLVLRPRRRSLTYM